MIRRRDLLTFVSGFGIAVLVASFAGPRLAFAVGLDEEQAELVSAMSRVKVSLLQGLAASEREGQPISGKFEVEDGKLQLSVYTARDGKFSEVIVDHMTGSIAKAEPITEGEDLVHAKAQKAAMDKAKIKLADAVGKAKGQVGDASVVSVVPELKSDHPVATIVLLVGKRFSTISAPLD